MNNTIGANSGCCQNCVGKCWVRDSDGLPQCPCHTTPANTTDTTKGLIDTYGQTFTDLGKPMQKENESGQECEVCKWRESEIGYPSPCPRHQQDKVEDWENALRGIFDLSGRNPDATLKRIADLIHRLLSSQRQDIIEKIEGMKIIMPDKKTEFSEEEMDGYNNALAEVLELIKNK